MPRSLSASRVALACADATHACREVEEIDGIQSLVGLGELNLAFNRIKSVSPLSSMTELRYLNVMHNQIRSMRGIGELHNLRTLKVSNNQIRSLLPVSQLPHLQELWVQNNAIASVKELEHLGKLKKLEHLWLLPNQCCSKLPPRDYRRMLVLIAPSLEVLDTQLVTSDEKEVLSLLPEEVERKQAVREIQQRNDLQPKASATEGTSADAPEKEKQRTPKKGPNARPGAVAGSVRGARRKDAKISSPAKSPTKGSKVDVGSLRTSDLISTMDSMLPSFEPSLEQQGLIGKPEGRGRFVGLVKRKEPKHSNGIDLTTTIKCRAALSDPKAHMVEYEGKYPGSSVAVVVHHDGSAMAKWPGEQLAVSVDSDILDSGDGKHYTLFAVYRSTGLTAISFDTQGNGFANFPNGQIMLHYNQRKDHGVQYDHDGKIVRTWSKKESTSANDTVEIVLDANLAFCHRMPEAVAEVYFACNGVKHKLVQGFNPPRHTWVEEESPNAPSFIPTMNSRNPSPQDQIKVGQYTTKKAKGTGRKGKEADAHLPSLADISDISASLFKLNADLNSGKILSGT